MPTVTALRKAHAGVAVELDGTPWRTLPLDALVEAGVAVGIELDGGRVRAIVRARRRLRAEQVALRALARREHSREALDGRLSRAGVSERERGEILDRAERSGLVDDARYAEHRARDLADRGGGDLLVLDDLVRHGVAEDVARAAVERLEPEAERAMRLAAVRGASVKTIRYLAARGFAEESLETVIAEIEGGAVA